MRRAQPKKMGKRCRFGFRRSVGPLGLWGRAMRHFANLEQVRFVALPHSEGCGGAGGQQFETIFQRVRAVGGRGVLTACKIFLPALVANLRGDAWPPTTSSSAAWLFVGTWVQTLRQNCFEDIRIAPFVATNPL